MHLNIRISKNNRFVNKKYAPLERIHFFIQATAKGHFNFP
jgi:hypothetical protein